jgi:hypothetical protein
MLIFGADARLPAGIMFGAVFSVCKTAAYGWIPVRLAQGETLRRFRALMLGVGTQLITAVVLVAAVRIDTRLFFSVAAGMAVTTAVIMVNAVSEKLGWTRNRWGEG